jgi:intraflagellar transport protein 52
VLGRPTEAYRREEVDAIHTFVAAGGAVLVLSGDGGDERRSTNLNAVLSPYGMQFSTDSVLRTAYHSSPYLHPKDCLVTHPIACSSLESSVKRLLARSGSKGGPTTANQADEEAAKRRLDLKLAYPRGCTLQVTAEDEGDEALAVHSAGGSRFGTSAASAGGAGSPATRRARKGPIPVVALTSGHVAYPVNQPIAAAVQVPHDPAAATALSLGGTGLSASASASAVGAAGASSRRDSGRVLAMGSGEWLTDKWLSKEHNSAIADALIRWLLRDASVTIEAGAGTDRDLSERHLLPDITSLAESLRACLQESEPLPRDFTKLFHSKLFGLGSDPTVLQDTVQLYKRLDTKHEPLRLIAPHFETPLPDLEPAVFPPTLREPPAPSLEQFDLDEHFASERLRLAQLTNKCAPTGVEDLEFYIKEAGEIVGATQELPADRRDARHVLESVLRAVVAFKKLNQDDAAAGGPMAPGSPAARPSAMFPSSMASPSGGSAGMGPGQAAGFRSEAAAASSAAGGF